MKNIETIREDLNKIKYYNSKKEWFDKVAQYVGKNEVAELFEQYNTAICKAHPKLYEFYVSVYVLNNTHEVVAEDNDCSTTYVGKWIKNLIAYFQENLN